ncbi:uridine kinase family-domain-containing protein [Dichotomocladium elegans]|nr:uridine kinase family-domain-containing protein [Dichotomocladium elegans]
MSIDATPYADPSYFKVSLQSPMVVAVAGGANAGKRDVCELLMSQLNETYSAKAAIISLNDFYREITPEEREQYENGAFNLDHPDAFDFKLLQETIVTLLSGNPAEVPVWDSELHTRSGTRIIEPVDAILVEGTLVLFPKELRDLMFMKIFIDVDSDQRLIKRVTQPRTRNGHVMTIKEVLTEYVEFVKPMFDDFISPTKKFADVIIPRGAENKPALQVLSNHLEDHLKSRAVKDHCKKHRLPLWTRGRHPVDDSMGVFATTAASAYKQVPE